jgi:hypothetical protein
MPLEALRSVGEKGTEKPLTQTVPSHFGRLPRQGQALQYGAVTKARAFWLQCPTRESGGRRSGRPTAGESTWRAIAMRRVSSGGKHPDLCERGPLRGGARECGSWPARGFAEGVSSPSMRPQLATMGCSSTFRGGESLATSPCGVACEARGDPSLRGGSAHENPAPSFQSVIGATSDGVAGSPASGVAKSGGLGQSNLGRACKRTRRVSMGFTWLAARSPRRR